MANTLSAQLLAARSLSVKTILNSSEYSDQLTRVMTTSLRRNKHTHSCAYRKLKKEWIRIVK